VRATGRLIALFSFDVGYEVDLDRVRTSLPDAQEEPERRRAAPPYQEYATPPVRLALGRRTVPLGDQPTEAVAGAIVHEFGAVTITLEMPLDGEVRALPGLTARLTGAGPLEDAARRLSDEVVARLAPAVTSPTVNTFVEDYYVIQVDHVTPPTTIAELLAAERGTLAAALRCEPVPLADPEVEDVFRTALSYYPDDLIVTEWNVALVVDRDYRDALRVLEYLNVQLVELRYYDAVLDRRVATTFPLTARPRRTFPLAFRSHRRALDELASIRLDVATIIERVHNALKLSGDLYLAKVYARTAERLALKAWEDSIERKLDVLEEIHDLLSQRVVTARAELLELIIVVLILIELLVRV